MYRVRSGVIAVILSLTAAGEASGGVITITGDPGDGVVDVNGLGQDFPSTQLRLGTGGDDVRGHADIFFFALPKLSSRDVLLGAELRFQYLGISQFTVLVTPEFDADLYGLG